MQPSSKSAAAVPKLNSEMEMGSLPADESAPENDIMQLARIGDIPGMEKLFESGEFDATYTDGEGITPLHVSADGCPNKREGVRSGCGCNRSYSHGCDQDMAHLAQIPE